MSEMDQEVRDPSLAELATEEARQKLESRIMEWVLAKMDKGMREGSSSKTLEEKDGAPRKEGGGSQ